MAIAYSWAPPGEGRLYGSPRIDRVDGPDKAAGRAQYSYDRNLQAMLRAKLVSSAHAHTRVTRIDTRQAEKIPGVRGIEIIDRRDSVGGSRNRRPGGRQTLTVSHFGASHHS